MARTKTHDPFDIGIESLLTSSDDDPNFDFDLFMEHLWQDCPELARDFTSDHSAAAQQTDEPEVECAIQPQQPPQPREPQEGMYCGSAGYNLSHCIF